MTTSRTKAIQGPSERFEFMLKLCEVAYDLARREYDNPRFHRAPSEFLARRRCRSTLFYRKKVTQHFEFARYAGLSTAECRLIISAWDCGLTEEASERDRIEEMKRQGVRREDLCPSP